MYHCASYKEGLIIFLFSAGKTQIQIKFLIYFRNQPKLSRSRRIKWHVQVPYRDIGLL